MSSPRLTGLERRTQPTVGANDAWQASSNPIPNNKATRPRKHIKKLKDDPQTEKTESVYSDDPAPASSGVFVPTIPKFSLEKSFPSILSTVGLMQGSKSSDSLRSLSRVFSTCLRTIVHSMDGLPHDVRLKPEYEVAQFAVIFSGNLLKAEVSRQAKAKDPSESSIQMALELVDMTVTSLRSFLKVAERILAEKKPLPKLPTSPADPPTPVESMEEEPAPLVNVVEEVLNSEEDSKSAPSSREESDTLHDLPTTKKKRKHSGSIIRNIVHRRRGSASKTSIFTHRTKSSLTLLNTDATVCHAETSSLRSSPKESFSAEVKERAPEMPYLPRQSAIYYLADPYCPEIDVDMPLPTGDAVAVRLDQNGVTKAASLTALVRILTSKESVTDPEFSPTFFICFRFFTTPAIFLDALMKRYDEQPPPDLDPAQLRVWTRDHMAVHIRVGKTIFMWLDLYWKPEVDVQVLETLQAFTLDRLVHELPEGLVKVILEGLDLVWGENPLCRRSRKAFDMDYIYHYGGVVPVAQTGFTITIDATLQTGSQLLAFDCPAGREELAHQLTLRVSEQFQQIDPEDAIKYWHLKDHKTRKGEVEGWEVGKILKAIIEFERALCSWVTFSVLDECDAKRRRDMLEFWLDISARCIRLRNFSGAHCILGGLSNGSITRLKRTVLTVSASSKQQFRALQTFFGGQDNYAGYREILSSVEPTVPMIAPLIRDVISALDVVPTSVGSTDDSKDKNLINLCSYRIVTKTVQAMESCLIPYKLTRSEVFHTWLDTVLPGFPSNQENDLNDKFYDQSKKLELKDESLSHLDPWLYTVTGMLGAKYTLHKLPPPPSCQAPTKRKNHLASFLRRC
ncbi:ras guanine nucleotide exchange factor domain-containing protein [Lyophyllum atratum]|nr:ras guanine nucleotide exchange factor domain-containing protein [Lyophyllum atratum]